MVYRHERDEARRERDEAVARAEKAEERASTLSQGVDWAVGEREDQIKRAEKAEAALARAERVTGLERAVVEEANAFFDDDGLANVLRVLPLCDAVRALRAAQEEGQ